MRLGQRVDRPAARSRRRERRRVLLRPEAHRGWAGLTLSRRLSESVGLGLTWYGVYRGQSTRKRAEPSRRSRRTRRSIAVLGRDRLRLPALPHAGQARPGLADEASGTPGSPSRPPAWARSAAARPPTRCRSRATTRNGDGRPDPPTLDTDSAGGPRLRLPLVLGGGRGGCRGASDSTRLYASAEWYAPVDRFAVIAASRGDPPGASAASPRSSAAVLNGGLGFEHVVNDDVSVYGAFHTDFSASVGERRRERGGVGLGPLPPQRRGVVPASATTSSRWAPRGPRQQDRAPSTRPVPPNGVPDAGSARTSHIHYSKFTFLLGFVFGS